MGHDHSHAPEVRSADDRRRLVIAIVVIGSGVVLQFTGALLSGSLALLADSAHMLSDLAGLVIALVAVVIAAKPPTPTQTFGRRRVEVLAAMANALMLGTVAIVVAIEAIGRLVRGEEAELGATVMLVTGIVGGLCNLVALLVLSGGRRGSINLRGAYLEVMGDLLGSVAVVAA
ncbi:cation diffusion facilitator family transporter, partial [Mycetocola reblochoni]